MDTKLRIIKSPSEFYSLVGIVYWEDFPAVPIKPDTPNGIFDFERGKELQEFCVSHLGFHIASEVKTGIAYNFYVEEAECYFLCYGDPDPNIVFVFESFFRNYHFSELVEGLADKFPTKFNKINRVR